MSHFTTIKTRLSDVGTLLLALSDHGFDVVKSHTVAQQLLGYWNDVRQQIAEVIVRRKYVGKASNDIGFKRNESGSFGAIISRFDRSKYDSQWLAGLTQRYAYLAACSKLQEQGFSMASEETRDDGRIHLVLRRMS